MPTKLDQENIEMLMEENFVNYASFTVGENLLRFQINHNSKFRVILDKEIKYFGSDIKEAIKTFNKYID